MDSKFYLYGKDAIDAMLRACESATETIDLEHYIFHDDTTGLRLIEILRSRARAGVKVRVLCDAVGSWNLYTSRFPADMRADGIEVRFVNIISPWRVKNFLSWFFRDHRKILIIDKRVGFTGGVGFRDDMHSWRDTTVEVHNKIVGEMLSTFNEMWTRAADRRWTSRIRKAKQYARGFQFLTNSPYFRRRYLYYGIIDAIRNAKQYVYVTTPYFVPDRRLARVLKLAAKRGVDVRILLPNRNSEPELFVGWATQSHYEKMLEAGARIFEYKKSFLHSKTIVIDDEWATVGSFNLDSLSTVYNYEANIVSTDTSLVETLRGHFTQDLFDSEEVTRPEWLKRPLTQRVREILVWPIRRFL